MALVQVTKKNSLYVNRLYTRRIQGYKEEESALRDFKVKEGETKRHMLRITPQAERPFFDPGL
ncbi:hypothetical protein SLS53_005090 [Cytospora paraplurivora]|uniref:Uncharacterized protein n=1 Tax=Cytospora paraplurivora TaxID=2898453 RepID=A0AAN9YFP7_9PEZI